jgi:hypothetical protein
MTNKSKAVEFSGATEQRSKPQLRARFKIETENAYEETSTRAEARPRFGWAALRI